MSRTSSVVILIADLTEVGVDVASGPFSVRLLRSSDGGPETLMLEEWRPEPESDGRRHAASVDLFTAEKAKLERVVSDLRKENSILQKSSTLASENAKDGLRRQRELEGRVKELEREVVDVKRRTRTSA